MLRLFVTNCGTKVRCQIIFRLMKQIVFAVRSIEDEVKACSRNGSCLDFFDQGLLPSDRSMIMRASK